MANTIGTAYIQIAPNMSGVQGKISSQLSGSGSAFAQQFGSEVSGKSALIIGALAGVASAATNKAMSLIASSIGDAVKRVDTLNAAQKTFEYMGFKAQDAAAATKAVTQSILGLPTPLDGAVRGMTALAATYQDVKLGQKVFSALNDAILGFGGSTAMVDGAVQQLSQLPLDGPLDAQTWNSLRNNGLTPVMVAMGKDMGRSVSQLKDDFGSGKLTVQDFVNELTKLDTEGGGGLVALHKIALNATSGISTGFQNMQTAISRGMASIIQSVGQKNISSAITAIGSAFEVVLKGVSKFFDFLSKEGLLLPALAAGLAVVAAAFGAVAVSMLPPLGAAIAAAAPFIAIAAAIGAAGALVYENWSTVSKVFNRVATAIRPVTDLVGTQLKNAFGSIIKIGGQLATSLKPIIDSLKSILANKTVQTVLKGIGIALLALVAAPVVVFFATMVASITLLSKVLGFVADHFTAFKIVALAALAPLLVPIALVVGAVKLMMAVFGTLVGVMSTVFSAISAAYNATLGPVFSVMINIIQTIFGIYVKIWAAIALVVVGTMFIIGGIIGSVMQTIWGVITTIWNAIYGVISSVVNAIWGVVTSVWNAIYGFAASIFGAVAGVVSGAWNAIYSVISSAVSNIWNSVTSVFNSVVSFVGGIGGRIVSAVGNFGGLLYNKGRDLIQGLLDGAGSLLSKIGQFFLDKLPGWIQGPFKKALGISSPSKVFAGYGGNIADGLINGIANSASGVTKAVSNMADSALSGMQDMNMNAAVAATVTPSGAYSTLGSGGAVKGDTINQYNTVNNNVDLQKVINDMTWELNRTS